METFVQSSVARIIIYRLHCVNLNDEVMGCWDDAYRELDENKTNDVQSI